MAFSVALYHFSDGYRVLAPGGIADCTTKKVGVFGVEGFFIISGFCFFYLYGAECLTGAGLRDFHIKRFFRIAPLYYLAVAANLLFKLPAGPGFSPRMLLENATFTFGLIHPNHSLVTGGWSIGLEYVFYLAFPLLVWASSRWRPFLLVGALVFLALSLPANYVYVPRAPREGEMNFHAYVQVANHAFLFLLGGLIARARVAWSFRLKRIPFGLLALALILAFVLPHRHFYDDFAIMAGGVRYYFLFLCFAGVGLFAFYDFPPGPVRAAGKFLGEVSYSVYLLHPIVMVLLLHAWPGGLTGFLLGLVLTLGLSALTFRFIERPMMALGRRLGGPSQVKPLQAGGR